MTAYKSATTSAMVQRKPVLELRGERLEPEPGRRRIAVRRFDWWPCFVCGVECRCPHREPDLVSWMEGRE